jgi:hypothetical protein
MEITNTAPSTQPKRDQPQEMDTTRSRSASRGSDSDTRSIPDDPDARKVFIQEVSGVMHSTFLASRHDPNHVYNLPESSTPPKQTPNRHAQRSRPPNRPPCLRARSTQSQSTPILLLRPLIYLARNLLPPRYDTLPAQDASHRVGRTHELNPIPTDARSPPTAILHHSKYKLREARPADSTPYTRIANATKQPACDGGPL